ncbi:MAG: protein-tyrosine-phosphatase [Crocinitomicaceae bacterium]|nr:protein-tyrosine-phosphatase [Crocinitomicaceae bacterium]
MFPEIQNHCEKLTTQFHLISEERKELLVKIARFISSKRKEKNPVQLLFVCTHNSRRSHFGQVWAAVAAEYYQKKPVFTYSGGTEETTFNQNAIAALDTLGFNISKKTATTNPIYEVDFGAENPVICFSKVFDDKANPTTDFAAIMTCSDAEENCPFIPGAKLRIATTYDDPKAFDGTPIVAEKYLERSNQIALEMLFVFSLVD